MAKRTFIEDFRKFFGRGLAILLPSILTLWILWQLIAFVYTNVGEPINKAIRLGVLEVMPLVLGDAEPPPPHSDAGPMEAADDQTPDPSVPAWYAPTDRQVRAYLEERARGGTEAIPPIGTDAYAERFDRGRIELRRMLFRDWWNAQWYLEATGLIVAIILIYLCGLLLGNLIGRRVYTTLERVLARVPGFKQIYPHVKQLVELVMGDKKMAFSRAVLVEWPSKGLWSVGLVTSDSMKAVRKVAGGECLAVFIPSTPTPFTGFTITMRVEDVVDLPITIDQAMLFIITAGVLSADAPVEPGKGPGEVSAIIANSIPREAPLGTRSLADGDMGPAVDPDPRDA